MHSVLHVATLGRYIIRTNNALNHCDLDAKLIEKVSNDCLGGNTPRLQFTWEKASTSFRNCTASEEKINDEKPL